MSVWDWIGAVALGVFACGGVGAIYYFRSIVRDLEPGGDDQ